MTSNPRSVDVGRCFGRRSTSVARENPAAYVAGDRGRLPAGVGGHGGRDAVDEGGGPPLGLPVLAEVPELADPLEALVQADRSLVRMVVGLARLLEADGDTTVETTGVGIEHWLALAAGSPRLERRTWLRAARLLLRLPQFRGQVEAGLVSAGQLRGLAIALRGASTAIDPALDDWLADAAAELHRLQADPDAIVEQARHAVAELTDHVEVVEEEANRTRQFHLRPRLDGSGGTFSGDEDAYGFALLEAATRPRADQSDLDIGRARADNLQALLHGLDRDTATSAVDPERRDQAVHGSWAEAIAAASDLDVAHRDQLANLPSVADRIVGYAEAGGLAPPKVLLRVELSSLIDNGRIPASLLTALTGGQLRVTSDTASTLIDAHGAELRMVIVDDGEVVGVGRATRRPPGWLTDTIHALHDDCSGPFCDRSALTADIDHAAAWHPHGDQPAGGATDVDNLGPLCRHLNRDRAASGWHPDQHGGSGIRTWTHPRTGLRTTSVPATWRPPPRAGVGPPGTGRAGTGPPDESGSDTAAQHDDVPF